MLVGDSVGISAVTICLTTSTTDIVLDSTFAVYRKRPSGVYATSCGFVPTVTVPVTLFVAESMKYTSLLSKHTTATCFPSGETVRLCGLVPTLIALTNLFELVSRTDTTL